MKKMIYISVLAFSLSCIFFFCSELFGLQTDLSSYYASPNGTYTMMQLQTSSNPAGGQPNENTSHGSTPYCFCAQSSVNNYTGVNGSNCDTGESGATYINQGVIFADPTAGYLEICKSDGSFASYPGACINMYQDTNCSASHSCPSSTNYTYLPNSCHSINTSTPTFYSYACCFMGSAGPEYQKAGCFSLYSQASVGAPAACNDPTHGGDVNAYDVGCDTLVDTNTVYKRNCCFNYSSGAGFGITLGSESTCNPLTITNTDTNTDTATNTGTATATATDTATATATATDTSSSTCFAAGTKITLADGSVKNIEDIVLGDVVLSYDIGHHHPVASKVLKTIHHTLKQDAAGYLTITMASGTTLNVTASHPFYVNGQWRKAGHLKVGDLLMKQDGSKEEITTIIKHPASILTYNLTINQWHDYFAQGFLVHNKGSVTTTATATDTSTATASATQTETGCNNGCNNVSNADVRCGTNACTRGSTGDAPGCPDPYCAGGTLNLCHWYVSC